MKFSRLIAVLKASVMLLVSVQSALAFDETKGEVARTEIPRADGGKETITEVRPSEIGAWAGATTGASVGSYLAGPVGAVVGDSIGAFVGWVFGPAD